MRAKIFVMMEKKEGGSRIFKSKWACPQDIHLTHQVLVNKPYQSSLYPRQITTIRRMAQACI